MSNLSCTKEQDSCENVSCQNGGTCLDGICDCPNGFVGEFCEFTSGTFTDTRDNQSYSWVKLKDGKKWMAKNLNYKSTFSYCYDLQENNCDEFGRLYDQSSVLTACPIGWHLPSDEEWKFMIKQYGGHKDDSFDDGLAASNALIYDGYTGFDSLFGGEYYVINPWLPNNWNYKGIHTRSRYWSSTDGTNTNENYTYAFNSNGIISRGLSINTSRAYCRCIEN